MTERERITSLSDLASIREKEAEEKNKLSYKKYVTNLRNMVKEENQKVMGGITKPVSNEEKEFICMKEPYEFIHLFQSCSGQDQCVELFWELLNKRDERIVDQVIKEREEETPFWFNTTMKGIHIRPGLEKEEVSSPMSVLLGDDSVHGLVVGKTGSGKSVLLNSMIFTLLAEYAPWEIDLYLVDFKKVELSRYLAKYDVPHIKAVAATSEIRYVISLLTYLVHTMRARQDFFAKIGEQKLSDLREKYTIVFPQVLILVDEFQQMYLEATAKEETVIAELITAITKLGRATGYHLLFASQEMSGTNINSAIGNFGARFALQCESDVSVAVLGNSAASKIDRKGIVLLNVGGKGEENNQLFKVPFLSGDEGEYFYGYLEEMTRKAAEYGFVSVHKFYEEERIKSIQELEEVLDSIKEVRGKCVESGSILDVITLGEAVVFNYKQYDYETFFLERGIRKNIGIFSPYVEDTAYIGKLLATNFMKSPRVGEYTHFILARNDLFMKNYDLEKDLKNSSKEVQVYHSTHFFLEMIQLFNKRCEEIALLDSFGERSSLDEFAKEAIALRIDYIAFEEEREQLLDDAEKYSQYFKNKSIKDIPCVVEQIVEEYEIDPSYFRILGMLYEKKVQEKVVADLYPPRIVWVIGAEMVEKFPKEMEKVLERSTHYNMLFIVIASNIDFQDFYMVKKTCDYVFVSGNNEKYYTTLNIPFTKKAYNSIAIDFAIISTSTQRSFKKFQYDLEEVVIPEIDFDGILSS